MDMLKKLSPPAQVVLAGTLLYVIFSFFDWQQVCFNGAGISACGGVSEWHGFGGTITVLSALLLLVWEIVRLLNANVSIPGVSHGLVSLGLALLMLLLTIITFLTHNEARHWPAYIGLVLAIAVAAAAFMRSKTEGVEMSDFGKLAGNVSSSVQSRASSSGTSTEPAATPPAPPAAPSEPASGGDEPAS